MLKTEYLGYKLDEIYSWKEGWVAVYLGKTPALIEGKGMKPESACADAQKKIKRRVNEVSTNSS